ncbi:putative Carrier domain-containing protein [Seiridium cardinale]|uniref:Carrier domain-containing protein n=1 Tax=Seiridium cardinale TaxID=138064 RepID=A0ABR2XY23_9PEZI
MRLLHAKTQTLHEFYEDDIPSYAILSHTWGEGEVTFRDIGQFPSPDSYSERAGWVKIRNCCLQALKDGLEYVLVDTCCIDKSSSAELQEAINSMFRWYKMPQMCYAYLVDVRAEDDPKAVESSFRRLNWFKRGWTLQELIAPVLVRFVDMSWNPIGTRYGLRETISEITGIKQAVLVGAAFGARQAMRAASMAQRMSWAAFRSTSRVEDMAYSLLGIFEINVPLIYGEGNRAFQRLQEEIIKISDDQTILA